MTEEVQAPGEAPKHLNVRQAAFIGVGAMVGAGIRAETGASAVVLVIAIAAAAVVLVTFIFTTLIHEPASIVTLLAILALGAVLDFGWKRARASQAGPVRVGP